MSPRASLRVGDQPDEVTRGLTSCTSSLQLQPRNERRFSMNHCTSKYFKTPSSPSKTSVKGEASGCLRSSFSHAGISASSGPHRSPSDTNEAKTSDRAINTGLKTRLSPKKRRSYAPSEIYAHLSPLPDLLKENLDGTWRVILSFLRSRLIYTFLPSKSCFVGSSRYINSIPKAWYTYFSLIWIYRRNWLLNFFHVFQPRLSISARLTLLRASHEPILEVPVS